MAGDWWHKALANKGTVTLTLEDVSGLELHILTEVLKKVPLFSAVVQDGRPLKELGLGNNVYANLPTLLSSQHALLKALENAGYGFPDDE